MSKILNTDILVVGGGLVGSLFANFAADAGFEIVLVDKSDIQEFSKPGFDGRASAVSFRNKEILAKNNIWSHLETNAQPILDIRVSEEDSKSFLHFDHQNIGNEPLGYMLENRYLRKVFYNKLIKRKNIKIFNGNEVKEFFNTSGNISCKLSNSIVINSSLLIAADGSNSTFRRKSNIDVFYKDYKQTAIVATVKHEKPHNGVAHERFRSPGPFAILPLPGNFSSLVWVEKNNSVNYLFKLENEKFQNELQKRFGNFLGKVEIVSPKSKYKLRLIHAKKYFAERLVLLGDSAHSIHPLAGQNFNSTIQDISSLVLILKKRSLLGMDIGSADILKEYDNLRRPSNDRLIAMTTFLNSYFSTNRPFRKITRRLGIDIVNKVPDAKNFFMKYAGGSGVKEDTPDFSDINTFI